MRNPPEMWVRSDDSFEPIIDPSLSTRLGGVTPGPASRVQGATHVPSFVPHMPETNGWHVAEPQSTLLPQGFMHKYSSTGMPRATQQLLPPHVTAPLQQW